MNISQDLARKIIIDRQLIFQLEPKEPLQALKTVFSRLGYVQIDTINVVNRAHHHTLWNRFGSYSESYLHEMQKEKLVFEYWGHAASYLPINDYRFYLPLMDRFCKPQQNWVRSILNDHSDLIEPVLTRIREEGPLSVSDFKDVNSKGSSGWWNWKPAKKILELLFWQGRLMVRERRNFQRIYDLTENVLPSDLDTSFPDRSEVAEFLVLRAIQAQGIISEREILKHINTNDKAGIKTVLKKLTGLDKITTVKIEDLTETYYSTFEFINSETAHRSDKLFILSPFDNLIINRQRILKLFGFDYKLECYYPEAKRKYGYFSVPLLYKNGFIGRLDCKSIRKEKTLLVRNVFWEDKIDLSDLIEQFGEALVDFAKFNYCNAIMFQCKIDRSIKKLIRNKYELRRSN